MSSAPRIGRFRHTCAIWRRVGFKPTKVRGSSSGGVKPHLTGLRRNGRVSCRTGSMASRVGETHRLRGWSRSVVGCHPPYAGVIREQLIIQAPIRLNLEGMNCAKRRRACEFLFRATIELDLLLTICLACATMLLRETVTCSKTLTEQKKLINRLWNPS